MVDNIPCNACSVAEVFEKEESEKLRQNQEKEFNKMVSLEIVNQLKQQNAQLPKQYEEADLELKKSHSYNKKMLILAIVSSVVAILSLVATIVIGVVK